MRRLVFVVGSALLTSCLPEDTRPPPAEVLVSLRGAERTIRGFTTVDGWDVRFRRVLVTVGGVDVEGDACDEYSDADYFRVLDAQLDKPQKIGLIYGLGTCDLEFRARNPETDSLLGENVSEDMKKLMREPGSDPYEPRAGITFLVIGSAQRGAEQKQFWWNYRRPRVAFDACVMPGEGYFTLGENQKKTIELQVHADVLFHTTFDPMNPAPRFDHLAAADVDGDSVITIEELATLDLRNTGIDVTGMEGAENWKTVGDYLYDGQFPQMLRIGPTPFGRCKIRVGARRP